METFETTDFMAPPSTSPLHGESAEVRRLRELALWQHRLLPLLVSMLVSLTVFGLAANIREVYVVQRHIQEEHEPKLDFLSTTQSKLSTTEELSLLRWKTMSILEASTIENRYHQASILLMARVYVVFLGFATGMVMSLMGAAFILGKFNESRSTSMDAGTQTLRVSFSSASPGIILAAFGAGLMLTTILARADISVRDQSLYLPTASFEPAPPGSQTMNPSDAKQSADLRRKIEYTLKNGDKK